MPFTVTHAAVAVPIAWVSGWRLPFSAVVIGTMVPDLAGFFPALLEYRATHSVPGLLTHCTPLGVMLYYAYQTFLKQPLFDLAPESVSSRLWPWIHHPVSLSVPAILMVVISVPLGAATHLCWDSFTHAGTWTTQQWPLLEQEAFRVRKQPVYWFEILQLGSSLLVVPMAAGFAWWLGRQPPHHPTIDRARMPQVIVWLAASLWAVAFLLYLHHYRTHNPGIRFVSCLATTTKNMGATALVVFLMYAVGMNFLWWRDRIRPPHLGDRRM